VTTLADAIGIVRAVAPDATAREVALVVAIGGHESHWGDGFVLPDGTETHNWGAITKGSSWTGPTFVHGDSKWTPTGVQQYSTEFRSYGTAEAGAADLYALLTHQYPRVMAAARAGSWQDVARLMYEGGYYSGVTPPQQAIRAYYDALRGFLVQQGIPAGAFIVGLGLTEMALWAILGWLIIRHHRKGS
jgi:hypothetical protein